jgi:hypothetical protein
MEFTDGTFVLDTIEARIRNISFTEKSGLEVKHLEAYARVTPKEATADKLKIETANSLMSHYFSMSYVNFHSFFDYNALVMMNAEIEKSQVSMKDLAYFIPQLQEQEQEQVINTKGTFYGSVDNLKGKGLELQSGRLTKFYGDIDIKGLPDISETYVDFRVKQLLTDVSEVKLFFPSVKLPGEFSRLGTVNFNGSFTGFFDDFVAYGVLNTDLGQLQSDLNMKLDQADNARYSGSLVMTEFNIGRYSGVDSLLGTISFDAAISGSGLRFDNVDARMTGTVQQLVFNGYNYRNIEVDGSFTQKLFTGKLSMVDENVTLDFLGLVDLNDELPIYNFHADIRNANLDKLQFSEKPYQFSTRVDMNMRGDNIDNFIGYTKAINTIFSSSTQSLAFRYCFAEYNRVQWHQAFPFSI